MSDIFRPDSRPRGTMLDWRELRRPCSTCGERVIPLTGDNLVCPRCHGMSGGENVQMDGLRSCTCSAAGLVEEITLALRGQSLCPRCGGDGCDWSAERYAEAVLDYQNAHECTLEQARSNVSDFDAMEACSVCDGSGAVHTGDLEAKKLEAKKLQESE